MENYFSLINSYYHVRNSTTSASPSQDAPQASATIRELLSYSSLSNEVVHNWIYCFPLLGVDLSNQKIIEAINEEPNPQLRATYLKNLTQIKTHCFCLSWSIAPELDVVNEHQIYSKGYWTTLTTAFFTNTLNHYSSQTSLPAFTHFLKDIFSRAVKYNDVNKHSREIIKDWLDGKPTLILTGWKKHSVSVILYNNIFVYGNKGVSLYNSSAIQFYIITKPENLTEQYLKNFHHKTRDIHWFENNQMHWELGLINCVNLKKKGQSGPFCSFSYFKLTIQALLILGIIQASNTENTCYDLTKAVNAKYETANIIYQSIKIFDRVYALSQLDQLMHYETTKGFFSSQDRFKLFSNFSTSLLESNRFEEYFRQYAPVISEIWKRFYLTLNMPLASCMTSFGSLPYVYIPRLSEHLLQGKPPGSYLIRAGRTKNGYVLLYVNNTGKVTRARLDKISTTEYMIREEVVSNLEDLICKFKLTPLSYPYMNCNLRNKKAELETGRTQVRRD